MAFSVGVVVREDEGEGEDILVVGGWSDGVLCLMLW